MRTGRSGEDRALGGCGRRLNELRGTLAPSLTEKRILQPASHAKPHSAIPRSRRLRLSVTSRRPGSVGQPPARLRGTMENTSTGQMRSSNHPPACGAGCAGVRKSRFGFDLTERRTLPNRWVSECAFPSRCDRRMRLSVRVLAQNALFRKMRLFSPGQTWRRLTEKRTLPPAPHGKAHSAQASHQKAHSGLIDSRKSALCDPQIAQNALFRYVAAPGRCGATPPARLRGTMENASTGQTRSSNPPPACGAACARVHRSRFGVWPHGKAHSAQPVGSRMRFSVTT